MVLVFRHEKTDSPKGGGIEVCVYGKVNTDKVGDPEKELGILTDGKREAAKRTRRTKPT